VKEIHQTPDGVSVVYEAEGQQRKAAGRYGVCTIPLSVLSTIPVVDFDPAIKTGIKGVGYAAVGKIGLQFKRRFWEEDDQIFGGHLYSNLPLGEFSYPSSDFFSRKGVLLGLYANATVGDLINQPVKTRVEHVLTHASKVHPQIRQEFESAFAVWWRNVKYSQGGYAAGVTAARRAQLSTIDNRVIIGSAATAPDSSPDWMEGAVAAAWQALSTLHERAMRV